MSSYQTFIFKNYFFDAASKLLTLNYSYDDTLEFTETYKFDFEYGDYNHAALDRACQLLFFIAGVSYYKLYLAAKIEVRTGAIDAELASFLSQTYQAGLGEFFYINQLDPRTSINFPINSTAAASIENNTTAGLLIGLGGGKDSLVSLELMRDAGQPVATWSVGHRAQLAPLVERIGLPHYWVERTWDVTLLEHNASGAYNGHVPISAVFATAGVVTAILAGKRDVVVSNEHSANEPTLDYQGVAINHQYSKSQQFEAEFQTVLQHKFGDSIRYYSLLRPFSELKIAELFSTYFDTYHDVFSSCNRAFTHDQHKMSWDGTCPKCAFVFLALTPKTRSIVWWQKLTAG
jgi:hypothetical protein